MNYRHFQFAAAAACILLGLSYGTAYGQSPALDPEVDYKVGQLWNTILKQCDSTYYYLGSNLGRDRNEPDLVTEYQKVKKSYVPKGVFNSGKIEKWSELELPLWQPSGSAPQWNKKVDDWGVAVMEAGEARQSYKVPSRDDSGDIAWTELRWRNLPHTTEVDDALPFNQIGFFLDALHPFGSTDRITVQMVKVDGEWYFSRYYLSAMNSFGNPSKERGVLGQGLFKLGQITTAPPTRCPKEVVEWNHGYHQIGPEISAANADTPAKRDLEARPSSGPSPGHLITDTYSRSLAILHKNERSGVPDAYSRLIPLLAPLSTCNLMSVSRGTFCTSTGKIFRMPGDLKVPLGFWDESGPESYRVACKRPVAGPWIITLQLVGDDGRDSDLIACQDILTLAALRKQLLAITTAPGDSLAQPVLVTKGASGNRTDLASRTYQGTMDGFASNLPAFIRKANPDAGTGESYNSEIQYILETGRACGRITSQMISAATDKKSGILDSSMLQMPFIPCVWGPELNVTANTREEDVEHKRNLMMTIKPHGEWGDGTGFVMTVWFARTKADAGLTKRTPDDLRVVVAAIE